MLKNILSIRTGRDWPLRQELVRMSRVLEEHPKIQFSLKPKPGGPVADGETTGKIDT